MRRLREAVFFIFLLLLPTQLGRHFWPEWTRVLGLRIDYLSPTFYLTDIILFFLILSFLPQVFSSLQKGFREKRFWFLAGGVFLLCLFFGIFRAKVPPAGFYWMAKLGEFVFLAFYLTQTIKTSSQFKKITLFLSSGVIFESLLCLGQFLKQGSIGGPIWWLGERTFTGQTPGIAQADLNGELFLRPYGTFSHPNVLAGYLVVVLALILGTDVNQKWGKWLRWLAIVFGGLALFFTFSRLAWITGFLIFFYWLIVQKKWLLTFLIILFLFLVSGSVQARFRTLATFESESWQKRQELNIAAWEMIKAHPLFGVGLGNFLVELPKYHQEQGAVRFLQPAHNLYLMITSETGLVGLSFFLAFLLATFKRLLKKQFSNLAMKQVSLGLLFSLLTILSLSFFDHYFYTLQQTQLLLSLVFGLSWVKIKD